MTPKEQQLLVNMAIDKTGDTPVDYTCPICLGLVYNPLTCSEC